MSSVPPTDRTAKGTADRDALGITRRHVLTCLNYVPVAIWHADANGCWDFFNGAWADLVDRIPSSGEDLIALFHPEDRLRFEREYLGLIRSGQPLRSECRMLGPDGRYRWVRTIGSTFHLGECELGGYLAVCFDVSDLKQAEDSRARFEAIMEVTPDLVGIADALEGLLYLNRGGRRLLGIPDDEDLTGEPISRLHPAASYAQLAAEALPKAAADGVWRGEALFLARDGEGIPASHLIFAHRTPAGTVDYYSMVARDIRDQKAVEQALCLYRAQLDQTPDAIFVADLASARLVEVNETACRRLGYGRAELLGMTVMEVDAQIPNLEGWLDFWQDQPIAQDLLFESEHRRRDGTTFPVEICGRRIRVEGHDYAIGIARDLTQVKRAHNILQSLMEGTSRLTGEDFMRTLVRELAGALNTQYAVVAERLPGSPERVHTLAVWARGRFAPNFEYVLAGSPCERVLITQKLCLYTRGVREMFPDDELLVELGVESYAGIPFFDSQGTVLGHLVVIDDKPLDDNAMFRLILAIFGNRVGAEIERQRMEETMRTHQARLAHLDRLHSMGEMATGIAHELNQPLTAISNYANGAALRLKRGNGIDAHIQDALSEISKQARRAGGIISRMRAFVAKREPAMTSVDLNEVATEAMRLCQFRAKRSRARIVTEFAKPLPLVCGDAVQLEQVILNLLLNAVEALEENDASPRTVLIATGSRDGQVILEVRDTGPGLPPGIEDIVFDQFVTTKLDGLGLGLPISRSIIRAHGGQLVGENHPDGGARFWFTLDEVDGPCHE